MQNVKSLAVLPSTIDFSLTWQETPKTSFSYDKLIKWYEYQFINYISTLARHKSLEFRKAACLITEASQFFKFHGVQRKMISVDNFLVFLRLLFFALLLLYVT